MKTKNIIQRALPLNVKYFLVSTTYKSLEDGGGCGCDNCGKLITNVAHIRNEYGKMYAIGLDCLDTILENTNLLDSESYFKYQHSDKPAIQKAKSLRSKLIKKAKTEPTFRAIFREFKDSFGFSFEVDVTRTYKYDTEAKKLYYCEPYITQDPQGFDFTYRLEHKELTLNYIKGLTNVVL